MSSYDYGERADATARLAERTDAKAARIRWMLELPDLSRTRGSPVFHLLQRVLGAPCLAAADVVTFPDAVSVERNFDLLNAPADHPSRRASDTYYVDERHVLRTQTTGMWTWYLRDPRVRRRLSEGARVTAVSFGKVYRNDEIDRLHYPVFHQIDALSVAPCAAAAFDRKDLDEILLQIARVIYGNGVETRILDDVFPFTHSSRQLEVKWDGEWIEVVGAGLVHGEVLRNLELNPAEVNGWAFGFGLDRLAMRKMGIPDIRILWSADERITSQFATIDSRFTPVSKFPAVRRDISFVIDEGRSLNDFYEIVRECGRGGDESIVEEVAHLDRYEDAGRFGAGRVSQTFRIVYRSFVRTLTNEEINAVQERIRQSVATELDATLR